MQRWRRVRGPFGGFIDEGSEIEGRYTCAGTVLLNGRFRGEIDAKDTLIIGEHGTVQATIRGRVVLVHGEVVGNLVATERVELRGSARVVGDVEAPVVVIEEGVHLDGRCRMTDAQPAEGTLSVVPVRR